MSHVCIAVVDDDSQVRDATSSLLRSLGYLTQTYASAEAFLTDDTAGIDCVLSDYQMPGMTGIDLIERVRSRPEPIPVVLMTAHGGGGIAEQARQAGAAGFLEKPIDDTALIVAIASALA